MKVPLGNRQDRKSWGQNSVFPLRINKYAFKLKIKLIKDMQIVILGKNMGSIASGIKGLGAFSINKKKNYEFPKCLLTCPGA